MSHLSKIQATSSVEDQIINLCTDWKENKSLPSDNKIERLCKTIYERDRSRLLTVDNRMEAQRIGIEQGMKLMRQIIESNY